MGVFEVIEKRRSIRKYRSQPLDQMNINRILEAARLAPSAANCQPWHFIVVTDPETRQKMKNVYDRDWFVSAPLILIGCADPEDGWVRRDGENYSEIDVAIAMQNMVLVATELGLGTCWVADFDEAAIHQILQIPEAKKIVAIITVGYPDTIKGVVTDRKSLNEIVHFKKW